MKLSIVIPVYNEAGTIREIVSRIHAVPLQLDKEIVIVDNCSTDGTRECLKQILVDKQADKILLQERNRGKGAALRKGFEHLTGDIVIVQDADLEYDPKDYPKLLEPILEGRADVVYGSRFLGAPCRGLSYSHFFGNRILTFVSNLLNKLVLTDMLTGYKAFRTHVLSQISLKGNYFSFEPEFTAKIAKRSFRIYEVPISYRGRSHSEGKKITWRDGFAILFLCIWYRLFD